MSSNSLADVQNHLDQGYFTDDDMKLLGMNGYVTVATMRAELVSLLTPKPVVVFDDSAEKREEASQAAATAEAKETQDRAELIQGLADQAEAQKTLTEFKNAVIASGGQLD